MKKLILTTITSLTVLAGAFAQCVPGSDYPSANFADSLFGAWPDTTVGFPDADQGVYYSQNLTFKIPLDGGEIDPLYTGLAIDSFWVDTVIGLPPCLSYSTNNPNGSYLGGELGCIEIFGTCNTTGSYDVTIKTLGWATLVLAFSVPYDFVGYHIEVNPPCNISLTASGNDASTTGGSDGDAMAMATGGQGNVTYMWSNGGTTSMISGLIAGTYGVTVMDDILAGCEAIGSVTVSEPPAGCLIAVTASGTNVTSNGGSDGSAAASISGELGNITYAWSNSETTSAIVNITAGVYTVTVTDDIVTGCSASATVTITEPALTCDILVNLSVTAATTAGGSDGAAEALVSGAQGNLSYMWSNGGTTSMITGLPTNTYSVTVSDDVVAGCTASASGLVTDPSVTPPL